MNTAQIPPVPAGPLLEASAEPRAGPVVMLCALQAGGLTAPRRPRYSANQALWQNIRADLAAT
jgi:hypothetical protein